MTFMQKPIEQSETSRSPRVKLPASIAKVLTSNAAKAGQLQVALQTLAAADKDLVAALASDEGHDLAQFESWKYEEKGGVTYLVLVPAAMPIPVPQRPVKEN
jgi:hypothetical protein